MPSVGEFQESVWDLEGFEIRVMRGGRDVRDDKQLQVGYARYNRAMNGGSTVADWRVGRFARILPEYEVDVLDPHGRPVHGKYHLSTVRDMYF